MNFTKYRVQLSTEKKYSSKYEYKYEYEYSIPDDKWAATWDFQQCGMCDEQSIRSACAYAQSDQSLC